MVIPDLWKQAEEEAVYLLRNTNKSTRQIAKEIYKKFGVGSHEWVRGLIKKHDIKRNR